MAFGKNISPLVQRPVTGLVAQPLIRYPQMQLAPTTAQKLAAAQVDPLSGIALALEQMIHVSTAQQQQIDTIISVLNASGVPNSLAMQAGDISQYSEEQGRAGMAIHNGSLYKGGANIYSEVGNFPLDAQAGDSIDVLWDDTKRSLMTGTEIRRIGIEMGDALIPYAKKIQATLLVNGQPVPSFKDALVSLNTTTLDGDLRASDPQLFLPYDSTLAIRFTAIINLGGLVPGATGEIYAWTTSVAPS